MVQAGAAGGPASPVSPGAKKLRHLLQHKLPVAREDEAIKEVLKVIKTCSKEELASLALQPPPVPTLDVAACHEHQPMPARLAAIQSCISSLQYNHATGYNYIVSKQRPLPAILATSAGILMHPLPIKCIEAVFLGILLTQGWTQLQRLPMGFKSRGGDGNVYRHIVLAVYDTASNLYGALGISRCSQLMDKQLRYSSLAALVDDYQQAYRQVKHELLKVRVGLPVEHDAGWTGPVCWRYCTVNIQRRSWNDAACLLNQHAAAAAELQLQFRALATSQSSSRSVPCSPRGSPGARPHTSAGISAGPHSKLRVDCGSPMEVDSRDHLPALSSPLKHHQHGTWHSPAGSNCSSPTTLHIRSSPRNSCGSPKALKCPQSASQQGLQTSACAVSPSQKTRLACEAASSADCESTDDEDDSDSDVHSMLRKMTLLQLACANADIETSQI